MKQRTYYIFYNRKRSIGIQLIEFDEKNFYKFLYRIYTSKSIDHIKKIYYFKKSTNTIKSIYDYNLSLNTVINMHLWNDFTQEQCKQQLIITRKNIKIEYINYFFK